MALSLDSSEVSEYIKYCGKSCGFSTASAARGTIRLRLTKDQILYEPSQIIIELVKNHNGIREMELLGESIEEKREIQQYMTLVTYILIKEEKEYSTESMEKSMPIIEHVLLDNNTTTILTKEIISKIQAKVPLPSQLYLQMINAILFKKTYLVCNRPTLADNAVFYTVYQCFTKMTEIQRQEYLNLARWFDQMQHICGIQGQAKLKTLTVFKF